MGRPLFDDPTFGDSAWQMSFGERFAFVGLLGVLRPALALETGTADGGSLRRIAEHAGEVHCFDIDPGIEDVVASVPNARAHVGDSADTLPAVLGAFEREGRHVDFALVDGDHTAAGVRRDALALLDSSACVSTTIVFHDAANDEVRAGLDGLDLPNHPKVAFCALDFVPGYVVAEGELAGEVWNGLGLVVLSAYAPTPAVTQQPLRVPVPEAYGAWRRARAAATT